MFFFSLEAGWVNSHDIVLVRKGTTCYRESILIALLTFSEVSLCPDLILAPYLTYPIIQFYRENCGITLYENQFAEVYLMVLSHELI